MPDLVPVYTAERIQERVAELGRKISADYKDVDRLVVIGVLKGAYCFLADLVRQIRTKEPLQIEFVRLSSYGGATESSGEVQTPYLELPNLLHRHILIVEDIVDSGRTATFFKNYLQDQFQPSSLKMVSLLDKPSRRKVAFTPDYVGFTIGEIFVVGYGLDLWWKICRPI